MTAPLVLMACRTMVVLSCAWTVSTLHSGLTPMPSPALLSRATGQKRPLAAGRLGDPTPLCCWSPVDCWQRTCIVSWVFVGAQRTVTPVIITPGHTGLGLCATVSTVLSRCVPCLPNGSSSMSLSHTLISLWKIFSLSFFLFLSIVAVAVVVVLCRWQKQRVHEKKDKTVQSLVDASQSAVPVLLFVPISLCPRSRGVNHR